MDLRKLKDKALEYVTKHRFDKAAEVYAEICASDPKDLGMRQRWADALRSGGNRVEAVRHYEDIATAYAHDGQLLKAIAINKVLLEIDPNHSATQHRLAELYARKSPLRVVPMSGAVLKSDADPLPPLVEPEAAKGEVPSAKSAEIYDPHSLDPETDFGEVDPGLDSMPSQQVFDLEIEDVPAVEAAPEPIEATEIPLPDSPLFESLDEQAFVALLERCTRRPFGVADRLIQQGDEARSFFVLSSGQVVVTQSVPEDGEERTLATLGPGDFFGELALLSNSPRVASVIGTEEGEALEFPGDVLRQLVATHPAADAAVQKFTRSRLLRNAMATSPLFRPFAPEERTDLISRFVIRPVTAGFHVLIEGTRADGLYVVMQGRFGVVQHGKRIASLGPGEIFGEMSMLTRAGTAATVVAETDGRVLRLPAESFNELIMTHPQVLELVSNLAEERKARNEGLPIPKVSPDVVGLVLI